MCNMHICIFCIYINDLLITENQESGEGGLE